MVKVTCSQLRLKLAEIKDLKKEFDLEVGKVRETRNTENAKELQLQIEEKISNLKEIIVPREIRAIFINPENNEQKEITINIAEQIQEAQEFYKKHNLEVPSQQELMKIWRKNNKEIKSEIEKYGYDNVLIVPENLPSTENLHQKMTEGYIDRSGNNCNTKDGLAIRIEDVKNTEQQKIKIILCHSDKYIYENDDANFFAKQTLGKNMVQLSGLIQPEFERRIQNKESLPICFKVEVNGGDEFRIQAEGFSLDEYLVLQRQYFEKNQKHLDEKGWTWLPKTFSGINILRSHLAPGDVQLYVQPYNPGRAGGGLACRLSRSFSL